MKNEDKDNIYARWITNQLSKEEENELKASGDWEILQKIVQETSTWSLPEMKADAFDRLRDRIQNPPQKKDSKIISIDRYKKYYAIAASILILIAAYWLFVLPNEITYTCEAKQIRKVILPDQTEVVLNGNSSLTYVEEEWEQERKVEMTGQAYFHVVKKGPFEVKFEQGTVDVLGTRFSVMAGKDISSVKCYEGTVKVESPEGQDYILTKGKGVRLFVSNATPDTFHVMEPTIPWTEGESSFQNTPLVEVINELIIQFNVSFDVHQIDLNRRYTGKFLHSDLKTALNMVFTPMGIQYELSESGKKVILK